MSKNTDTFYEEIKSKGYFSNTRQQTKWFDGIDLTVEQNFRESKEVVGSKNHITLMSSPWSTDTILADPNIVVKRIENSNESSRFFYQERIYEEVAYYRQFGCECCGKKLIMPKELSYGICEECDRRMFSKSRARKLFPELPESKTCCAKEFYTFNDKIDGIETHTQKIWTTLIKLFVHNKNRIEKDKRKWHPYLRYIG